MYRIPNIYINNLDNEYIFLIVKEKIFNKINFYYINYDVEIFIKKQFF